MVRRQHGLGSCGTRSVGLQRAAVLNETAGLARACEHLGVKAMAQIKERTRRGFGDGV